MLYTAVKHGKYSHENLRNHSCGSGSLHSEFKHRNKYNVKTDIYNRRNHHRQERAFAVPRPAKHRRIDIVNAEKGKTEKYNPNVGDSKVEGVGSCVEQTHDSARKKCANNRHDMRKKRQKSRQNPKAGFCFFWFYPLRNFSPQAPKDRAQSRS